MAVSSPCRVFTTQGLKDYGVKWFTAFYIFLKIYFYIWNKLAYLAAIVILIFLPCIMFTLQVSIMQYHSLFETFNNHGLPTEQSHSPHQLWVSSIMILQHHSSNYSGVRGIMDDRLPDDL